MGKQYAERDIMALDKDGGHYTRHLSAMTGEALHDKSDIAAELAWRDAEIARLEQERDAYRTAEEHQIALRQKIEQERDALAEHVERLREGLHQALVHWGANCTDEDGAAYAECEKRCDEAPTASLSRRDALKQAEWISTFLKSLQWNTMSISPIDLNIEAKKLRRQAGVNQ